ncbi:biotin--[acetyl-CoA-carboxylase] ligase [Myxococcota bacterium]|nr:biotin--[acetyl-CoA-carboxylase] ligase [Myxococcota bacterium]MBU1536224.1 biotin--[acetyl-CoA-carboxylase] ligase [Myxococcota bacterium]
MTILLDSAGSTNNHAKELIRGGRAHRLFITAQEQIAGRGRGTNTWVSPRGGIYLSLAAPLTGRFSKESLGPRLALAVRRVLMARYDFGITIKWPNDLLCRGQKLAGFLLELVKSPTGQEVLIVGLGVNVNVTPERTQQMWYTPTSISREVGTTVDLPELTLALARDMVHAVYDETMSVTPDDVIREEILLCSATIGHEVTVLLPGGARISGIARDVSRRFSLMLEHGGIITEVDAGDCFHSTPEK